MPLTAAWIQLHGQTRDFTYYGLARDEEHLSYRHYSSYQKLIPAARFIVHSVATAHVAGGMGKQNDLEWDQDFGVMSGVVVHVLRYFQSIRAKLPDPLLSGLLQVCLDRDLPDDISPYLPKFPFVSSQSSANTENHTLFPEKLHFHGEL